MEFVKISDTKDYLNRYAINLDGKKFEVSIHPVMFGYRIIGGFIDSNVLEFNWCCGNDKFILHFTQKVLMRFIEQGVPLKNIPFCSDIKPWPKDKEFVERITKLMVNPVMFAEMIDRVNSNTIGH